MNRTGYLPTIALASKARTGTGLHADIAAKPIDADPTPPPTAFDLIVREVCRYIGVQQWTVFDTGRHPRAVAARQLIVTLARRYTLMSYPEIARAMCRRSHSSFIDMAQDWKRRVENGVKVNTSRGDFDPEIVLNQIIEAINERNAAA
jgi:chromosomal replication initiation ATPase DnaA